MSSQPPSTGDPDDRPADLDHPDSDGEPTAAVPPVPADATMSDDAPPHDGAAGEGAVDEVSEDGTAVAATTPMWRQRADRVWHYARWPVYAAGAGVALLILLIAGIWVTTDLPDVSAATDSAILVDRNGDELAVLAQDGLRIEVPLDEMAQVVRDALIAAEDRRFYDHDGVDPAGIARALWNNITDNDVEGGSTLTQQLVKNVYLDDDRTISRKVREAVLAVKLERSSDKDEILERYLNTVYFGRGAYGIEAAARTYFDTAAAALTPEQAAFLVGILRSPEALDPAESPEAALERRNAVLDAMVETGTLDAAAAEAAKSTQIVVLPEAAPTTLSAGVAPHFVEQVRAQIVDEFGERALYDRGLVVHTTLDITDQKAAEAAVAANLDDPDDPQAAVVGIDRTGAIRAWVGGRDYDELKVDLVSNAAGTGRQPGSTFKPLVLAANFQAGYGAGQRFVAPGEITLDIPPEPWTVSNAGGKDYGTLTLFEGTVNSVNTVYAQALAQVGPQAVADLAEEMGIGRDLDPVPSIALGTEEVTPLELATVYSTFARSGSRVEPFAVTKVETRSGDVLKEIDEPEATEVLEPKLADTVSAVLSETPRRGTARRAALDRPMAAKTGTTQNNADAWLAGYTPEYTAIVWMGYPDGNREMETVDGERVQGGSIPAQIWHDFMAVALEDVEPTEFGDPDPELLDDTTPEASLAVSPGQVEPGERVVVSGNGYELCVNGWAVVIEGPQGGVRPAPAPAPVSEGADGAEGETAAPAPEPRGEAVRLESAVQPGSTESTREVDLIIPGNAADGAYRAAAACDFGSGLQPFGPRASFTVGDPSAPTTTTTTSSTSSTTTSSSTTTTTEPDDESTSTTTSTTRPRSTSTTTSTTTTTTPSNANAAAAEP